mmetsp:Transcript_56352/g.132100  ORF Transcript_56352/g.132100 Transcript_56352/m.132100 type:complete len:202 (+) Transcript_56352:526-1131(+)
MPKPGGSFAGFSNMYGPWACNCTPCGGIINLAETNSGAMISVVPTQLLASELEMCLATPKSMSFTFVPTSKVSLQTKTFSTFKSRWITSLLWMNSSPATTCFMTLRATSSDNLPASAMKDASSPPCTNSITIILYCACVVPGRKASQQPWHVAILSWPCIRWRTSTSRSIAAIFSSLDGSISNRQMGMVLTAYLVLGSFFL